MDHRYVAPRVIRIKESNFDNTRALGGFLFFGSTAYYVRSVYLKNRSVPKLVAFTGLSYLLAQEWSKVIILPVLQEAALLNNAKELGKKNTFFLTFYVAHQEKLKASNTTA